MALFAPVAPIQILEELKTHQVLGSYHLLLAHHVLEEPDRFRSLFADMPSSTIIMDNSIVELGDAASDEKVLEAIQSLQNRPGAPHWIIPVLTDVMGNGTATRQKASESYQWWHENAPGWPLMVVAQGSDFKDFAKTVDYFLADPSAFPKIEYVGIPRVLVESLGTRLECVRYLEALRPQINVHLLGFSDNVPDDIICANHPSVEGIDSAVPLRYSFSVKDTPGISRLYTPSTPIPPRPAEWFTEGQMDDVTYTNLYNIRKWCA